MTYQHAVELAFLCTAVDKDTSVSYELMTDLRFAGKVRDTLVIRKQFGKFTHYVQPLERQDELVAWQRKLNNMTGE